MEETDQLATRTTAVGRWIFQRRSLLPIPVIAALLAMPADSLAIWPSTIVGILSISTGEALRLWAVRHIGVVSRTRASILGPLITGGPYQVVRNPMYVGNLQLWLGITYLFGFGWGVPMTVGLFGASYQLMALWEEECLTIQYGESYGVYEREVRRWLPRCDRIAKAWSMQASYPWRATLYSERTTLGSLVLVATIFSFKGSGSILYLGAGLLALVGLWLLTRASDPRVRSRS